MHGYVRNLTDGTVEALAEGDDESVLRVERALRAGPHSARIDRVEIEDVPSIRPRPLRSVKMNS